MLRLKFPDDELNLRNEELSRLMVLLDELYIMRERPVYGDERPAALNDPNHLYVWGCDDWCELHFRLDVFEGYDLLTALTPEAELWLQLNHPPEGVPTDEEGWLPEPGPRRF